MVLKIIDKIFQQEWDRDFLRVGLLSGEMSIKSFGISSALK